jgi:hypothetical protein
MKTDAEREESFPLLLSTKIPLLKSTRQGLPAGFILKMVYGIIPYNLQMENGDEEEKRQHKERTRRD